MLVELDVLVDAEVPVLVAVLHVVVIVVAAAAAVVTVWAVAREVAKVVVLTALEHQ